MATNLLDHENLKAFKQHGFYPEVVAGNQVFGKCPFCGSGRKNSFYINPTKKSWDCKICGKEGGYQTWLQEIYKLSVENFTGRYIANLKRNRGLQRATLKHHKVGYNPLNSTYIIPIFDAENKKIWDLKFWSMKRKRMTGTHGCTAALYGWNEITSAKNIWLVEGEWDKMSMWEILSLTDNLKDTCVVSVPGALTFKNEWHTLFKGKNVFCVYDHDLTKKVNKIIRPGAGPQGTYKVFNALKNIAKTLRFVHWESNRDDGFDVRDLLNDVKQHETALTSLENLLQRTPTLEDEFHKESDEELKPDEEIFTGPRITASKVYEGYRKWLHLPDTDVLDAMFGAVLANRLDGDPIWLFLVAPSGATKTELLMSISEAPKITSTTSLTAPALVSGANTSGGGDPSLIPILNEKVLIIKDFTTILDMNPIARQEIFAILRDAYDGKTEKNFGNGTYRSYKSRFGITAGTTHIIELFAEGQTALGERFLRWIIDVPESYKERLKYLKRASDNSKNPERKKSMRKDLEDLGTAVLSHNYKYIPPVDDSTQMKLITLAQWTSIMRGTVVRDNYSKEIMASPFAELGTRLVTQFTKWAIGIAQFRGAKKVGRREVKAMRHAAISSIPSDLNKIMKFLYSIKRGKWVHQKELYTETKLPIDNCRRKLENMVLLNAIEKQRANKGNEYRVAPEVFEMIQTVGIY